MGLKAKALANAGYWMMPYVSASVNAGFNHAYHYRNSPLIEEAVIQPNFRGHTHTAFTYTLGAGIQKQWDDHWQLGAGYEFADWGKTHLGRAAGQTTRQGLGLNHLYTHGLLFNLTYLA